MPRTDPIALPKLTVRPETPDIARPMARLANDLHAPHRTARERQQRLLESLRQLLAADRAMMVLATLDHRTGEQRLAPAVHTPAAMPPIDPGGDGGGPMVESFVSLCGMQCVGRLLLTRPAGGTRFTTPERRLIDVLHHEFAWVYGQGAPLPMRE